MYNYVWDGSKWMAQGSSSDPTQDADLVIAFRGNRATIIKDRFATFLNSEIDTDVAIAVIKNTAKCVAAINKRSSNKEEECKTCHKMNYIDQVKSCWNCGDTV